METTTINKVIQKIKTCLFEGLRPHESRMLCPPNWVPFINANACSAQALKYNRR